MSVNYLKQGVRNVVSISATSVMASNISLKLSSSVNASRTYPKYGAYFFNYFTYYDSPSTINEHKAVDTIYFVFNELQLKPASK